MIYYLSLKKETPCKDYWDYGIIYDIFGDMEYKEVNELPLCDNAIVVLPARHHADMWEEVNRELRKVKCVILFLMGDEEGDFPVEKLEHRSRGLWIQNPMPGRYDNIKYTKLGTGYPPHLKEFRSKDAPDKDLDWYFAGQVTHSRREECVEQLKNMDGGELVEGPSFTKGVEPKEYIEKLSRAKIAPCPSGPITPDTFRLFEALELGCLPIADTQTPDEDWKGFWEWLLNRDHDYRRIELTTISDWSSLPGYTNELLAQYPNVNNKVQESWIKYKIWMKNLLLNQMHSLGFDMQGTNDKNVSVIIPVSPIKSHPDISIIEETINSVRHHLPHSEIIVTFDGVREEQEHMRADYEEHIRRVLWKASEWGITPYIFDEHVHQVGMARKVIDHVFSDFVMYVEQDTPLVTDCAIDIDKIVELITTGDSNLVRLHFEAMVPDEHKHLMIGEPENEFLKTVQWSQRPHIASTAFYRRLLSEQFSDKANCFIEDLVHGKVIEDWKKDKEQGWNQWRLHIYHPEGDNIKRSYHTDGRAGAAKYDDTQTW